MLTHTLYALHLGVLYALYLGIYEDVEPALNIAICYSWVSLPMNAFCTVMLLGGCFLNAREKTWKDEDEILLTKLSATSMKIRTFLHRLATVCISGILVSSGYMWAGSLFFLTSIILWALAGLFKKLHKEKKANNLRLKAEYESKND